jgi:hypothetical protein
MHAQKNRAVDPARTPFSMLKKWVKMKKIKILTTFLAVFCLLAVSSIIFIFKGKIECYKDTGDRIYKEYTDALKYVAPNEVPMKYSSDKYGYKYAEIPHNIKLT